MSVDIIVEITQYWEAIIAAFALLVSLISLRRDKRSRQMDMLHDVFRKIGELNTQLLNYNPNDKDEEQQNQDGMILLQEKFKEFDYLCYLMNRKKVKERDVYELGGSDLKDFYERYGNHMDDDKYSDIEPVVTRWETHPPTSKWNRFVIWWKKTMPSLRRGLSDNGNDEGESESSDDGESSEGEVEKAET